ncbi:hypothetical protein HRbin30_02413 [bacterium HR30]|nr:hypothetical protein HRbin30_02413 [bacterium HR30]
MVETLVGATAVGIGDASATATGQQEYPVSLSLLYRHSG